ncbi:LptF/LptG family permease [Candidatus Margulisiibacteriota bacterium]
MKLLDQYIGREMLGPFILGIVGFVLVMIVDLLFTFVDLIINRGVPVIAVIKLLAYKLPSIMVMTFPVATLFGIAMVLGRLSKDSELTALRTSGVSFYRIISPLIVISLCISVGAFGVNEKLVPHANQESEKIIKEIIHRKPLPDIKSDVFFKDPHNRYFYIQKMDAKTNTLEGIMVYELAQRDLPRVITAKKAKINGLTLTLNKGIIHKFDSKGHLEYEANFNNMKLNLLENPLTFGKTKTSQEMSSLELKKQIDSYQSSGVKNHGLKTDWHLKYSIPFTSFVFALIGIPLCLPGLKSSRTWGMVLTIVIMFTFYVFASVFRSLGRADLLNPFWAGWAPQISVALIGIFLIIKEGSTR